MSTLNNAVVEYPESDGQPMGETDWHIYWILRLRELLQTHYKDQRVYVGSDMFIYYEEGNPDKVYAPDAFVVFDCDPAFRRTFKLWEEDRVPSVIFEITSRSSLVKDLQEKPEVYSNWGVKEYFVFDPVGDCLSPALRGFQLRPGEVVEMEGPQFNCSQLGCIIELRDRELVLVNPTTRARWVTEAEQMGQTLEIERAARLAAEAEIARLREELEKLKPGQ